MSEKPKNRRLSLTKKQLESGPGEELLVLCQTVTEDGRLSDEEVGALGQWLETNRESNLPSIEYLSETVARIMADGRITPEERSELHLAIEKILPPLHRKDAKAHRLEVEYREGLPVHRTNFLVAGTVYENRDRVIYGHSWDTDDVLLGRDLRNPHSRHAIKVLLPNGNTIGFVPENDAVRMAPLLDSGHLYKAHVTRISEGELAPFVRVEAEIHVSDSAVAGLRGQVKRNAATTTSGGLPIWPAVIIVGTIFALTVYFVSRML